ncbi:DUF6082 family protein [Streptomyces sp. V1I1]|uniref:DUF6082 family protein n=1 Tax=Streptomyces sp. V1I1 TaxID=3042272 RepID=UPI00277F4BB2|nr:DUF6082 family protein [Streptomyces sp. V1I1]MDQ0940220.1 citrate synthase [Streptomyces sp. V1I1]
MTAQSARAGWALRLALWVTAGVGATALIALAAIMVSSWLIQTVESQEGGTAEAATRGQVGDYFGGANAIFSGLAFLSLLVALLLQYQELRMQRRELADQRDELTRSREALHRNAEASMRSLHIELMRMAMDDPDLAAVWNDYPDVSVEEGRQHLYANLIYGHFVLAYDWNRYTDEELMVHARGLQASEPFRRFWEVSRGRKLDLPEGSNERRLVEIMDAVITAARPAT